MHLPVHSFYPKGLKLSFFPSTGSHFQDTARFSKLPDLGMKLGHWQKFQKLHLTLFLPSGVENELIFTLRAVVSEILVVFQNCHIWHEAFPLAKIPEVAHIYSLSTPKGSKLSLFSFYRQAVSEILADFQNCHS